MPTPGAIKAAREILIQIHWQGVEPTNQSDLKWLDVRAHNVAEVIDRETGLAELVEVATLVTNLDFCEGYMLPEKEYPKLWEALSKARAIEESING
jgi:hypothetical protein